MRKKNTYRNQKKTTPEKSKNIVLVSFLQNNWSLLTELRKITCSTKNKSVTKGLVDVILCQKQ